ncbi:MAG: phosphatase PAP2 family protein [candidate division NC10 bacterium]|nr:phosphatase PAP2 family protein [candidate division NC10 bacterium]
MGRTGVLFLALLLTGPHISAADQEQAGPSEDAGGPIRLARGAQAFAADGLYLLTAPLRLDRETAVLAGGLTLGVAGLLLADREIRERVQAATGSTGRDVADGVSTAGDVSVLFGVNAALLVLGLAEQQATGETRLRDASLVALEAHVYSALFTAGLKRLTGRARPSARKGAHHFDPFDPDDAFPSGHASRAFAVAAVFADRYGGPVPVLAYGAAGLVAASRLVVDEHWASDVVVGAALGIVVGRALSRRHAEGRRGLDFFPFVTTDGGVAVAAAVRF